MSCQRPIDPPQRVDPATAEEAAIAAAGDLFVDRAAEVGLDFVHFNGMSGRYYFVEMMGAGAALFDYDGDGDLDAYLVQGTMLGDGEALFPPRHPLPLTDRLYRNEMSPRRGANATTAQRGANATTTGTLRFVDITVESGLRVATGYGMGVAAGDVDNDGRVDLYVTRFGANQLLRNNPDGSFSDVTEEAGVDDPRWSVAAVFFDFDRDGWLDLYVGNYVDFTLGTHKRCVDAAGARDYCAPAAYRGETDRLFRNRGGADGHRDGAVTFEDVSLVSGVGAPPAPGLGALAADLDNDGWLDLYVANDGAPNFLWLNRRGAFEESALLAGCAVDEDGRPQASMGVDLGDVDNDGDDDLFMSHLTGETNTLFSSDGAGGSPGGGRTERHPEGGQTVRFRDATAGSGLGTASLAATGFGTGFLDFDNDGWLDLLVANGAVKTIEELASAGDPYPLHQRNLFFRNRSSGRFEEPARAGSAFELSEVSRGAAFGDVDNDGDVDVLIANNGGPARLLINQVGSAHSWLGLRLLTAGRDALGARLEVLRPGRPSLRRRVHTDGSYASASDPRVLVGLGDLEGEVGVEVWWPDGTVEGWTGLVTRKYHTLRQRSGERIR